MKSTAFAVIISVFLSGNLNIAFAQEQRESDSASFSRFQFKETEYNFGDLVQGRKAVHDFDFINSGSEPLLIQNVLTTCGCTAPEWPKNPIQPGDSGKIKIVFDSSAKIGRQNKVITVRSNAEAGDYRLRISAMVLPAKKDD